MWYSMTNSKVNEVDSSIALEVCTSLRVARLPPPDEACTSRIPIQYCILCLINHLSLPHFFEHTLHGRPMTMPLWESEPPSLSNYCMRMCHRQKVSLLSFPNVRYLPPPLTLRPSSTTYPPFLHVIPLGEWAGKYDVGPCLIAGPLQRPQPMICEYSSLQVVVVLGRRCQGLESTSFLQRSLILLLTLPSAAVVVFLYYGRSSVYR